jgi:hypothetical protein
MKKIFFRLLGCSYSSAIELLEQSLQCISEASAKRRRPQLLELLGDRQELGLRKAIAKREAELDQGAAPRRTRRMPSGEHPLDAT